MKLVLFLLIAPTFALPLYAQSSLYSNVDASLETDKDTVMIGEPFYFYFVLSNRSEQEIYVKDGGDYRNELGRPESFDVVISHAVFGKLKKHELWF